MHHATLRPSRSVALAGGVTVAAIAATVLTGGAPAGAAPAASKLHYAYGGHAFGTYASLGSLINVGKTANVPMCTTTVGTTKVDKTAKLNLGLAGFVGAVTSQVRSKHNGNTPISVATTHTASTTLLGALHLNAVKTSAAVSHVGSKYVMSGNTTFLGLTVAGQTMPASPKPNTALALPGLGSITLNEQRFGVRHGIPTATVIALDIRLGSSNSLGLPAGRVIVGQSTATIRKITRVATAGAWATELSVASVVGSGRTAAAYTGCGGTSKKGKENDVAGITLPNGLAKVGVAKSTVQTTDTKSRTTAISRNRIAGVTLLNGMIKVSALRTQANATLDAKGHRTLSAKHTTVLGLVVNGQSMGAPTLGQQQSIPGLGTLTFGYAHKSRTGIQVYGLRLVLADPSGGLPAGAVITVGAARAKVTN